MAEKQEEWESNKDSKQYQKQTEVIDLTNSSLACSSTIGKLESVQIHTMGGHTGVDSSMKHQFFIVL